VIKTLAHPLVVLATRLVAIYPVALCGYSHPILLTLAFVAICTAIVVTELREHTLLHTTADLASHPGTTAAEIAQRLGGGASTIRLTLRELSRARLATEAGDRYSLS